MAQGGRKIVIGVDESAFSEQAFNFYVENFLREDDTLFLVHTPERYNFVDANLGTPVERTAVLHELYDEINKKVRALENKYQEKIKAAGIKSSKFVTKQGGPGEAIVAVADKEKANMIVTGCRGMDPHRELLEEVRHKVEALEAKYNKKIETMGIKSAKFLKRHGDPGEAIVHVAEKEHANLIVTGCRGMGLLRRTFMGSVSDYVMHHASCPVLVCRK